MRRIVIFCQAPADVAYVLTLYARYLRPEEYGIITSMQVISAILLVFLTMAIDRGVYRIYYDYKDEQERKTYLGTVVITITINSIVILSLLFLFSSHVERIYKTINFYPYFSFTIIFSPIIIGSVALLGCVYIFDNIIPPIPVVVLPAKIMIILLTLGLLLKKINEKPSVELIT